MHGSQKETKGAKMETTSQFSLSSPPFLQLLQFFFTCSNSTESPSPNNGYRCWTMEEYQWTQGLRGTIICTLYVVVRFYHWFKFYFLWFGCGNLMIISLKQRK